MIPFRDENPTRSFPIVVVGLIAANVVIFLYELVLPRPQDQLFMYAYGAIPALIVGHVGRDELVRELMARGASFTPPDPVWLSVFTSMFLHGGLMHIGANMLYLWIFGNNVEDVLGHFRFLVFYFVCGTLAAGAQILMSLHSNVPMIGASGAIAGVLGAYYVKFPRARVRCLVFLFFFVTVAMLPASLVLLLWFLLQVLNSLNPGAMGGGGGVAVFAHIGGFLAGWALIRRFEPRRRRPVLVDWWR
ncbi:MAG: rhomboid family intramembrane serine protease [Armatimonadota bacterium]|nr:MAG: rhomboid family intramembrane serine protease [Armatimonadota bacterium]